MFVVKITKEIIKKYLSSNLGINYEIDDKDILVDGKNIEIKLHISDLKINYLEIGKMIQKQIIYEMSEHTDLKDYIVDVILGE